MSRGLTADMLAAFDEQAVQVFFAVDLEFDSPNDLHFWTGYGDLEYEGTTYTGAGYLLQVSEIQEGTDLSAKGATLTMSGIPSTLINLAITEAYQGRVAKIKFGVIGKAFEAGARLLINDTDFLLINQTDKLEISTSAPATMYDLFVGYMDQMTIEEGAETSTISLTIESKMIDLERPRIRRYTDDDQRAAFSGDRAFEFVTRLQNESLTWGV